MRSQVSAEKLARIAKIKVTTVRRTAKEFLEMLEQDQEIIGLKGGGGVKPDACQKCGQMCIEKDNYLRGPLEGLYEWLGGPCRNIEGISRSTTWTEQESQNALHQRQRLQLTARVFNRVAFRLPEIYPRTLVTQQSHRGWYRAR